MSVPSRALSFAEAHPNATAGALSAAGDLASSGSENRLRDAQASRLEEDTADTQYERMRRRQREAEYANLWSPLGQAVRDNYSSIPANPYAVS